MRTYFDLFRIKHWIKNLIVFFPAFFGGVLFNQSNLFQLSISFFYFSLAASTVYLFNDLIDYNQDKLHPKKKERPISSGKISVRNSIIILIVMYITLILGSFIINMMNPKVCHVQFYHHISCMALVCTLPYSSKQTKN